MSIQTKIDRIKNNVQTTLSTIADTGVAVPANANSDNLPAAAAALANEKLDKLAVEYNKIINFGSSGLLYVGKFGVYDTQVTVDITSTTSVTYSGKLVIATQNYVIKQATVYGDAANTITPNIFIKPSTTSDRFIEVYFKPAPYSKNVVHIYGSAIASAENVGTSVTSVPSAATLKPTNALTEKFAASGHTHNYLPLSGGTLEQKATIKWTAMNGKNPYIGYCSASTDGTFMVGSIAGTSYTTGLAIGGSSGNLLWKGAKILTVNDTASKATADGNGKNIASTYATKEELAAAIGAAIEGSY